MMPRRQNVRIIERTSYANAEAQARSVQGVPNALLFAAYDFATTTGGVVRRVPLNGAVQPCDYGGTGNKRPLALHVDSTRVYWTNGGDGTAEPYKNGSVASCDLGGCCATPDDVLWSGDGEPSALTSDSDAVYFVAHASGTLWKVAKP